jgi:hypothetical protein
MPELQSKFLTTSGDKIPLNDWGFSLMTSSMIYQQQSMVRLQLVVLGVFFGALAIVCINIRG